jgi:hypothetical protein
LNVSVEFNHGSVCWGSPWSQHSLISLFMDIIENEKINAERFQCINPSGGYTNQTASGTSGGPSGLNPNGSNLEKNLRIIEEIDEISLADSGKQHLGNNQQQASSFGMCLFYQVIIV